MHIPKYIATNTMLMVRSRRREIQDFSRVKTLYVAVAVRIQNLLQMVIFFYNSSILVSAGDIIGSTGSWEFFLPCNKFCILTVTATYEIHDDMRLCFDSFDSEKIINM